jgi:Ca2+/H+ antiporter, TMEM165/GDT1 family
MKRRFRARKIIGIILLAIIGIFVFGSIVMQLWNALMPDIFHLPVITFWQALGLLVLTKILFSGFRGGGPSRRWKEKINERWTNMTPEEREKFKQEWGRRCRRPYRPEEPSTTETADQKQ